MTEEMVTITKREYLSLKDDEWRLCCFENYGVISWGGWEDAMSEYYKGINE